MKKATEETIDNITAKWYKAKRKLQKIQAKEKGLRDQIEAILVKQNKDKEVFTSDDTQITFTRNQHYSIPKAAIPDIKINIPKDTFNDLFTTSYTLKKAVYDNMKDSDCQKVVKKHLTIKPSPLSVKVKELS